MHDNGRTLDEILIKELRQYHGAYQQLSQTEKESFLVGDRPTSAKALANFMERLKPEEVTYGQVKELIKFYYATQYLPAARRVFEGFTEYSELFRCVSPPLAGLRAINIHHVNDFLSQKDKSNVQLASRAFFHDDTRQKRLEEALLRYLAKKNEIMVEKIIRRYPTLLGLQVNLIDAFEKEHSDVTVFDKILHQLDPELTLGNNVKQNLGLKLLHHTIRGHQLAVVAILTRYPDLLLYRGNTVDYSGREFRGVTAFELAIWALDVKHMAPAMLKCLNNNEQGKDYIETLIPELQQQFDNVVKDGGGVNYTIGCGLLKMSEDPQKLLPDKIDEVRFAELNRKLNRRDGLIQYEDRLFYFHNLKSPKKLVEIIDPNALDALKGIINKNGIKLEVEQLHIITHHKELRMIQEYVPDSLHIFQENHYDFTPLIKALEAYKLEAYKDNSDSDNRWSVEKREVNWCNEIGLAQHYTVAHVSHHYCDPDKSLGLNRIDVSLTSEDSALMRSVVFFNFNIQAEVQWWAEYHSSDAPTAYMSSTEGPGLDFGIAITAGWLEDASGIREPTRDELNNDVTAINKLKNIRLGDVPELKRQLDLLQKQEAKVAHGFEMLSINVS